MVLLKELHGILSDDICSLKYVYNARNNRKLIMLQSDDRSAIVWRMSDYKEDFRITKPFRKAPHNTFYKRPAYALYYINYRYFTYLLFSWSPDGQFVVAAGGVKKGRFVAPIIPRGGKWQGDKDFVGHSLSVTCTVCNQLTWQSR